VACQYEYARQSQILRDVAEVRDEFRHDGKCWPEIKSPDGKINHPAGIAWKVLQRIRDKYDNRNLIWLSQSAWQVIWNCSSFPGRAWNQLESGERKLILNASRVDEVQPLYMHPVSDLDALGVLDKLKVKAGKAQDLLNEIPDIKPLIDCGQFVHALFTLDFSETKKRMLQRFEAWLDLPENKSRLARHRRNTTGKTGKPKDRLKDLAALRLHEKLGFGKMLEFTRRNRKRFDKATKLDGVHYKKGDPMPFHDARKGQGVPLNEAPLYSEESSAQKAKAHAKEYLTELIPWEFGELAQPKGETYGQHIAREVEQEGLDF
jgi:hypothetical protein